MAGRKAPIDYIEEITSLSFELGRHPDSKRSTELKLYCRTIQQAVATYLEILGDPILTECPKCEHSCEPQF